MPGQTDTAPPTPLPPVHHYDLLYEMYIQPLATLISGEDDRSRWVPGLTVIADETINKPKLTYLKEHIAALQEEYTSLLQTSKDLNATGRAWMTDASKHPKEEYAAQRELYNEIRERHGVPALERKTHAKLKAFNEAIKGQRETFHAAKRILINRENEARLASKGTLMRTEHTLSSSDTTSPAIDQSSGTTLDAMAHDNSTEGGYTCAFVKEGEPQRPPAAKVHNAPDQSAVLHASDYVQAHSMPDQPPDKNGNTTEVGNAIVGRSPELGANAAVDADGKRPASDDNSDSSMWNEVTDLDADGITSSLLPRARFASEYKTSVQKLTSMLHELDDDPPDDADGQAANQAVIKQVIQVIKQASDHVSAVATAWMAATAKDAESYRAASQEIQTLRILLNVSSVQRRASAKLQELRRLCRKADQTRKKPSPDQQWIVSRKCRLCNKDQCICFCPEHWEKLSGDPWQPYQTARYENEEAHTNYQAFNETVADVNMSLCELATSDKGFNKPLSQQVQTRFGGINWVVVADERALNFKVSVSGESWLLNAASFGTGGGALKRVSRSDRPVVQPNENADVASALSVNFTQIPECARWKGAAYERLVGNPSTSIAESTRAIHDSPIAYMSATVEELTLLRPLDSLVHPQDRPVLNPVTSLADSNARETNYPPDELSAVDGKSGQVGQAMDTHINQALEELDNNQVLIAPPSDQRKFFKEDVSIVLPADGPKSLLDSHYHADGDKIPLTAHEDPAREVVSDLLDQFHKIARHRVMHISDHSSDEKLADLLHQMHSLEQLGVELPSPLDEDAALHQRIRDSIRWTNGRYEVGLPWRTADGKAPTSKELPDNFAYAFACLQALIKTLGKDPGMLAKYDRIFKEYLAAGIISEFDVTSGRPAHFLSHHAVMRKDKDPRPAFNGSAKPDKTSPSLNDLLHKGPVLLNPITAVLLNSRLAPYTLSSDIAKAFFRITLHADDKRFCCFLWVRDITKPATGDNLVIYCFNRVIFGLRPSPALLAVVIEKHMQTLDTPLSREIMSNCYVDNIYLTADDLEEAHAKYKESKELFADMNMNLREFATNNQEFNLSLPKPDQSRFDGVKQLGFKWDLVADEWVFNFKVGILDESWAPKTKRERKKAISATSIRPAKRMMSSTMLSRFDPLGLVSPAILPARLSVQTVCKEKYGWDDPIDSSLVDQWNKSIDCWTSMEIRVPRLIKPKTSEIVEMHIFCDASGYSYGACAYLVVKGADESRTAHLIFTRSRLKPLNTNLTIPRLELMATVLGARLADFLQRQLNVKVSDVTLHLRNSEKMKTDVHVDAVQIMRKIGMPKDYPVHCHYWTGSREEYKQWMLHFPNTLFGFNAGSFSRGLSPDPLNLLRTIPLERVTFESDAPYHGKRGTSQPMGTPAGIVRAITQFKEFGRRQEDLREIAQTSTKNVIRLYRPDLQVVCRDQARDQTKGQTSSSGKGQTSNSGQIHFIGLNTNTMFELTAVCDAGCEGPHRERDVFLVKRSDSKGLILADRWTDATEGLSIATSLDNTSVMSFTPVVLCLWGGRLLQDPPQEMLNFFREFVNHPPVVIADVLSNCCAGKDTTFVAIRCGRITAGSTHKFRKIQQSDIRTALHKHVHSIALAPQWLQTAPTPFQYDSLLNLTTGDPDVAERFQRIRKLMPGALTWSSSHQLSPHQRFVQTTTTSGSTDSDQARAHKRQTSAHRGEKSSKTSHLGMKKPKRSRFKRSLGPDQSAQLIPQMIKQNPEDNATSGRGQQRRHGQQKQRRSDADERA